jgi:hypothetical protein
VKSRWRTPAALLALLLLTAGFYWKLTIAREWTWLETPDQANMVRPWLDFEAREFHAGRIPLWDPYEWGGHTLIGQVQPGVTNPLNWILFAMPLEGGHLPVTTLHWYWVLIHWLGAAACYALCHDLKAGYLASMLGAAVFALAGFVGHTNWPQILMPSIWTPVVFLFFARAARGYRPTASAALCGAALGMCFLSGHHVVPTFTAVLVGVLWMAYAVRDWRRLAHVAAWLAVWLLVSAAQVLPAIEYAKQSLRWAGAPEPLRWGEAVPYGVHAQYSLQWWTVPGIVVPGISLHANPHVGLAALLLAVAAIWLGRMEGMVRWFAAIAGGGLLLALGAGFPPYWLVYRFVPMVEKAREPAMAIVLFQLGIAVLAALGASRLRTRWCALALAAVLAEAVYNAPHLARFDRPGSFARTIEEQSDIAEYLKAQRGWFRVDFDDADVTYNFGDFYGIEQFGGAAASMPARVHRMLGREETPRIYGIRYYVGRKPANGSQVEVFASRSGLKVWRDARIGEPLATWREAPCSGADDLRVVSRAPQRVVVEADLACPALVIAGDAWYTGWRARVDGARRPVQEVDTVRAVRVEAGRHRIEFFYRPASVYWGLGLMLTGFVTAAYFCAREKPSGG